MTEEEVARQGIELGFSKRFRDANRDRMEELVAQSIKEAPTPQTFMRHLEAAMRHDTTSRLHLLDMPVLIAHGTDDWLLPHQNGERLAELIRGARLELFEGAGHALGIEYQDAFNELLRSWVRQNASRSI